MKVIMNHSRPYFLLLISIFLFSFHTNSEKSKIVFPWKKAGLTERQAAAHLLSRFTYGAKPGEVDKVVEMGLEKWFLQQLNGDLADTEVVSRLKDYDALQLSNSQVLAIYPRTPQVLKMAEEDGVLSKDTLDKSDKEKYKPMIEAYMARKGFKPRKELERQFVNQKIIRAAYSNNQLKEVLTDFWFNHFNVSVTKNDCAEFIPAYERDVIRPNVIGKFEDILIATAKSPAMLFYLDNFNSSGNNSDFTTKGKEKFQKRIAASYGKDSSKVMEKVIGNKKSQGLNENYAREVMELHTLGVDGGYTQSDVTQAAKILTGWSVYPISDYGFGSAVKKFIEKTGEETLKEKGFVHEGDFFFAANRHDNSEKVVLGKTFHSSNGYEEGMELLKMLAHHTSTANFICRKIAVRFVNDNPSKALTDKMVKTFLSKNGDIKEVLLTMVSAPEFWNNDAIRQKTKSPFELAMSAVRSLNADIDRPYALYNAINKMGQKMYAYQAPTGFPDRGQYWINTGALLNRMNFGLSIASQKNLGTKVDLLALNQGHEPESAEAALKLYCNILLPERNLNETIKRLTLLLNDPELQKKVTTAAEKHVVKDNYGTSDMNTKVTSDNMQSMGEFQGEDVAGKKGKKQKELVAMNSNPMGKNMLSQVVGIIIGSPEFQRR